MEFRQQKQGKRDEKAEECNGEKRKRVREEKAVPLMFPAATLTKLTQRVLLKMHDMHTTRKYVMKFKK